MPKITGGKGHSARLKRLTSPEAKREVGKALYAGGERIQVAAQIGITTGAVSGKGHVPGIPGGYPNADTHRLADNIETILELGEGSAADIKVLVSSNAPYSIPVHEGTSRSGDFPFMSLAVGEERKNVVDLVRRAVKHIAAGGEVTG